MSASLLPLRVRPSSPGRYGEAGLSLLEAMLAVALVGMGLLGTILTIQVSSDQLTKTRELAIARLAVSNVIETVTSVKIRASTTTIANDNGLWLFRGAVGTTVPFELARTASGTSWPMPDLRTIATVTYNPTPNNPANAVGGWVAASFPVPPLVPVAGSAHPGTLYLHVNETMQPTTVPTAGFPFPKTVTGSSFSRLDCDGDGAATTTNLRIAADTATNPARLIPACVVIEWRSAGNTTERVDVPFLIVQPGF